MRKILAAHGSRGNSRCLVIQDEGGYLVERYVDGKPKRKRFKEKPRAMAWAKRWYESGMQDAQDLTIRQLFDRYLCVVPAQKKWRGATLLNFAAHRKRIEEAMGPETRANRVTLATMDELWAKLLATKAAPNQVRAKVKQLQRVFAWAHSREIVTHSKPALWEVPEVRPVKIAEFTADESDRLLRAFDYQNNGWEWRPWALKLLMDSHGFRVNAALHLRWHDVDLKRGIIRLREAHDKTKREWWRPMTWEALSAFLTARYHADRLEKDSAWVFYGAKGQPFTYGAWYAAFRKAEDRAGVTHQPLRAAHGFRRKAVNDAREATGDAALGLLWVGNTDLRESKSYVREREGELAGLANRTSSVPSSGNRRLSGSQVIEGQR